MKYVESPEQWFKDDSELEVLHTEKESITKRFQTVKVRIKEMRDEPDIEYRHMCLNNLAYELNSLIRQTKKLCLDYLDHEQFHEIIDLGRLTLRTLDVKGTDSISTQSADGSIAIAEAINLAAKELAYVLYELKPVMIVAAWKSGADFGLGEDDAYYLHTLGIGTASFHDPYDEIGEIILNRLKEKVPIWNSDWSGVPRQDDAFKIIESMASDYSLAQEYANLTTPREMLEARDKYLLRNQDRAVEVIGVLLKEKKLDQQK